MIKLEKLSKPQVLIENAEAWTKEYLNCIKTGQKPSDTVAHRYKDPSIKETLEKETHGKCAYCESKIKHISFSDIEHILPKNINARPDLYVEWGNLTIACEVCNRINKKDYYDTQTPLINPYIDEPNDYFLFIGPFLTSRNNNARAFVTESKLDLNRAELVERRADRLRRIDSLLFAWSQAPESAVKSALENELRKECAPNQEFSAFVKAFLLAKGFPKDGL